MLQSAGTAIITMKLQDTEFYKHLEALAEDTRKTLQGIAIAATATGAGITAGLAAAAAKAASDAVKFRSIEAALGDSTDQAVSLAEAIHNEVGRSVSAVTKEITAFSVAATRIGWTKDQAVELGAAVTKMASDFNAFYGRADGFERIQAGIRGSAEALDEFNVNLSDSAVESYLGKPISQLNELQKQQARAQMLAQAFNDSQVTGSAAADSLGGAVGRLNQSMTDFTVAIGTAVQPLYEFGQSAAALAIDAMAGMVRYTTQLAQKFPVATQVIGAAAIGLAGLGLAAAAVTSKLVVFAAMHFATSVAVGYSLNVIKGWTVTAWAAGIASKALAGASTLLSGAFGLVATAVNAALAPLYAVGVPIAAVIAGAAALGAGLYYLQQKTEFLTPVLKALGLEGLSLQSIWDGIASSISWAVEQLMKFVRGAASLAGIKIPTLSERQEQAATAEQQRAADSAKESLKTPQQKFEEYMAQLGQWYEKGLIDLKESEQLRERAKKERDDAIRREFDQTEMGQYSKQMADVGKRIADEVMTFEEKLAAKFNEIDEAEAAGSITSEIARRASEAAQAEHDEAVKSAQKQASDAAQKVRDDQEKAIREKFGLKADATRAMGGDNADSIAAAIREAMIEALKEQGFDTTKDEIDHYGKVMSSYQTAIDQTDRMRESTQVVTRSAAEAIGGLGTNSVPQQQLEKTEELRNKMGEAVEKLGKIVQKLDEP